MLMGRSGMVETVVWMRKPMRKGHSVQALKNRLRLNGDSEGEMMERME